MGDRRDEATLRFLGGAGTVTGSKHLVTAAGRRVLLDCGLFQGLKMLRLRNWTRLPLPPAEIDAVVLSHAHIDHSGALPLLVREGFRGPIYCTPATADLLGILLRDAAHLQEEDAERANRRRYSKHRPAQPLYTTADAEAALTRLVPRPYRVPFAVTDGMTAVLRPAGHILGSATVELQLSRPRPLRLVFSGDLGRWGRPILHDPDPVTAADVLLVESTYGDRLHPPNPDEALARLVRETADQDRMLLVPAFAVGRTQELVWMLRRLEDEGRIPILPVVLDSPMAIDVTAIYAEHADEHDLPMRAAVRDGSALRTHDFHLARTPEESKALNARREPLILISASGMATGGRVLHHLAHRLPDPRTTVLLPGFEAAGTRGRSLRDGATTLRLHGTDVPVRAQVVELDGLSAHADRDEILRWVRGFTRPPRWTWVVHGEPQPSDRLAAALRSDLGWEAQAAEDQATVPLEAP
jgi:metallo-beta-lactamase family protein